MNINEVRLILVRARSSKGWSQQRLADEMGTVQSHVSELESGTVRPRFAMLIKWAEALGYEIILRKKETRR